MSTEAPACPACGKPCTRRYYRWLRTCGDPACVQAAQHSPESRAKVSAWNRGRKHTPEAIAKMSAAQRGHLVSAETREKIGAANRGRHVNVREDNPNWVGGSPSTVHRWANTVLSKECEFADKTCLGDLQCAFRHDAPEEFVRYENDGRPYYVGDTLDGYMRLCRSHHVRYDIENGQRSTIGVAV